MKLNMANARAFPDRRSWRTWLKKNHDKHQELWLVYFKQHTSKRTISYDDSVEEALCFGWIDGIIQRVDDERFARRFTPRRSGSGWSMANLKRMKKLQELELLSKAAIVPTRETKVVPARQLDLPIPEKLQSGLKKETKAREFFESLAPGYRRMYVRWISTAKRDETRAQRSGQAIEYLRAGKKMPR